MDNMTTPAEITYASILDFPRGTFFSLVSRSYAPIADDELRDRLRAGDEQTYDNPTTIAPCVTVTCFRGEPVGITSYDPRPFPDAIVGQNCILPEYRGKGFGRLQLLHLLAILKSKGFEKATATTTDEPFFEPAQRMYQACGFAEVERRREGSLRLIDYAIQLQ